MNSEQTLKLIQGKTSPVSKFESHWLISSLLTFEVTYILLWIKAI